MAGTNAASPFPAASTSTGPPTATKRARGDSCSPGDTQPAARRSGAHRLVQPNLGREPVAPHRALGHAESGRDLPRGHAGEETHLDDAGFLRLLLLQSTERAVERHDVHRVAVAADVRGFAQRNLLPAP